MKCPFCQEGIHDSREYIRIGHDQSGRLFAHHAVCPECHRRFVYLEISTDEVMRRETGQYEPVGEELAHLLIWPRQGSRSPASIEVPTLFADDYNEACLVLDLSPKSSAALSRRCLQHLLREKANVGPDKLSVEIQQAIGGGSLPSHVTESLDSLREIGNFAAHTTKDQETGEILDVESGEAEWTLETLESLFDFYFVMPAKAAARKAALNAKLAAAGRNEVH